MHINVIHCYTPFRENFPNYPAIETFFRFQWLRWAIPERNAGLVRWENHLQLIVQLAVISMIQFRRVAILVLERTGSVRSFLQTLGSDVLRLVLAECISKQNSFLPSVHPSQKQQPRRAKSPLMRALVHECSAVFDAKPCRMLVVALWVIHLRMDHDGPYHWENGSVHLRDLAHKNAPDTVHEKETVARACRGMP